MHASEALARDDVSTAMEYLAACTPTRAQEQFQAVLRAMTDVLISPIDEGTEGALRVIVGSSEGAHLPTDDLLSAAEYAAIAHLAASDARRAELHESMRRLADLLERVHIPNAPVAA